MTEEAKEVLTPANDALAQRPDAVERRPNGLTVAAAVSIGTFVLFDAVVLVLFFIPKKRKGLLTSA